VHRLPREVRRKRDRHRASRQFRLGTIYSTNFANGPRTRRLNSWEAFTLGDQYRQASRVLKSFAVRFWYSNQIFFKFHQLLPSQINYRLVHSSIEVTRKESITGCNQLYVATILITSDATRIREVRFLRFEPLPCKLIP
jgi:hypothetical protein